MFFSVLAGLFFLLLSFLACMLGVRFLEEKDIVTFFWLLVLTALFLFFSMIFYANAIMGLVA